MSHARKPKGPNTNRHMPSLSPRGGVRKSGPPIFIEPPVRVFRNLDPTFVRPAPATRDRGIGRAQLKRFEPAGPVLDHSRIKFCTSIPDFIGRHLLVECCGREDLAHVTEATG